MRRLFFLFVCSLIVGCGPYEGGGARAQHEGGTISQVSLDGGVTTSEDKEAEERAARIAKEEARQAREQARRDAEAEAEAAAEAAAAAVEATPEPTEAPPVEPIAAVAPSSEPDEPGSSIELEGNLAALIAEEEARVAAEPSPEPTAVIDPLAPADDGAAEAQPGEAPESDPSVADVVAAADPFAPEPAAASEDAGFPTDASDEAAVAEPTPELPALTTNDSLPPCDPNELAAVVFRDLTLKQTFGEGETARAVLVARSGAEFVVAKGAIVGPDGARVVRVSPGELILAEIQFDMSGAPVMVQKTLRMDVPR
ncbi:MAG: hypothetical protein KDA24_22345 [Deltaproteobacteria bacterium]|nr:hypothetical protein [Deltaproteobacteria bacterium]